MVVDLDLPAVHALQQMLLLGLQGLRRVHGHKLERRVGLGHKTGAADGHLNAAALGMVHTIIKVYDFLGRLGNALDILQRLGRQAHHEVEFDRRIATFECNAAGLLDLVPGNIFVDDIAQALGTGLRRKRQAALAHLGGLFNEALGEVVHTQRRQRKTDMLFGCPLVQIIQQLFQLAVVGSGQAGQTELFVARVGAELLGGLVQQIGIPLAHGAVQKARLAETAATDTAAQHLNAGAVLDGTHHWDDEICRRRKLVQILDDGLGDFGRNARLIGRDGFDPTVFLIGNIVERRDIHARNFSNSEQQLFLGDAALLFGFLNFGADAGQLILTLAQLNDVKEIRNGLRIAGTGAARHDQRPGSITVFGIKWDTRQVQHGQDVGIGKLVLEGKAHRVKIRERILALHGIQGQLQPLHLRFHIQPGHKSTLAPPVFVGVEQLIQDFLPQE